MADATFIRALLANRQNNSGQPVESETPEENTSTGHPLDLASLENIFGGHEENLDLSHLNAEGMENLENVNEMIKDGFWDNVSLNFLLSWECDQLETISDLIAHQLP